MKGTGLNKWLILYDIKKTFNIYQIYIMTTYIENLIKRLLDAILKVD